MSLLSIESVSHRYRRGRREYVALAGVSMVVDTTELVAVHGTRKSGKSTLLRIAAGLEQPDEGVVRHDGLNLADHPELVGRQIAYVRTERSSFSALEGELVVDAMHRPGFFYQEPPPNQEAWRDMQGSGSHRESSAVVP